MTYRRVTGDMIDDAHEWAVAVLGVDPRRPRDHWRDPDRRADELFRSLLSPRQRRQMDRRGRVTVRGSHGHRWRIDLGATTGNVYWVVFGIPFGRLCAAPARFTGRTGNLPLRDLHVGQLLALISDERKFVRVAHVYAGWRPRYRPTYRTTFDYRTGRPRFEW